MIGAYMFGQKSVQAYGDVPETLSEETPWFKTTQSEHTIFKK